MRKFLLAATAVVSLGGLIAANLFAHAGAQPVPPMAGGPPPDGEWRAGPHPGWRGGPEAHHRMMEHLRTFALLYRPDDRHLTPPDVQKIAEAFLLWNGNHSWKVTGVAQGAGTAIDFSIATPDGGVIARFSMDSKTGRVTRLG
jgi:hypothetical protein